MRLFLSMGRDKCRENGRREKSFLSSHLMHKPGLKSGQMKKERKWEGRNKTEKKEEEKDGEERHSSRHGI